MSHTLLGQVVFTLPVGIVLYLLTSELVWPWLSPSLPPSWQDLVVVRRPRGWEWCQVGASVLLGGLTHFVLDGFTHPASDHGWAIALLPLLGWSLPLPFGRVPVYDVLQAVLSLVLGLAAWQVWKDTLRAGRRRAWPVQDTTAESSAAPFVARWLAACAALGALAALLLRRDLPTDALEFAAYGALDGIALGMLVPAAVAGLRRRSPPGRGERLVQEMGGVTVRIPPFDPSL